MSKHSFLQAQEVLFRQSGADESQLRAELTALGYNDRYELYRSFSLV